MFMVFLAVGGFTLQVIGGATKETIVWRRAVSATHIVGILLLLVAGFGMLARTGLPWGGWLYTKLGIWVIFGGIVGVIYRKPEWGRILWWVVLLLGFVAAYMAIYKPF
jgi:hypothetical protein